MRSMSLGTLFDFLSVHFAGLHCRYFYFQITLNRPFGQSVRLAWYYLLSTMTLFGLFIILRNFLSGTKYAVSVTFVCGIWNEYQLKLNNTSLMCRNFNLLKLIVQLWMSAHPLHGHFLCSENLIWYYHVNVCTLAYGSGVVYTFARGFGKCWLDHHQQSLWNDSLNNQIFRFSWSKAPYSSHPHVQTLTKSLVLTDYWERGNLPNPCPPFKNYIKIYMDFMGGMSSKNFEIPILGSINFQWPEEFAFSSGDMNEEVDTFQLCSCRILMGTWKLRNHCIKG